MEWTVRSPFDDAELGRVALDTRSAAIEKLDLLDRAFRSGALPAKHERLAMLERLASLLEGRSEELARLAASEGGKPLVDSRVEVSRAVDGVRTAIAELRTFAGREIPMDLTPSSKGRRAYTRRFPRGASLAVSAFNHPLNLLVHQAVPAIAVGAPLLLKPASKTPLTCVAFVELCRGAGVPDELLSPIYVERDVLAELARDPRLGYFSFIGSSDVGNALRASLAPGVVCTLEHGGAAPLVVDDDVPVDDVVRAIAKGAFYHAGQVCVSVQRVFVPRREAEAFGRALAAAARALRVGDPLSEETEVGPLVRRSEVERVDAWVEEAQRGGGRVLCGGVRLDGNCYAPTVVLDAPADVRLSREEVFGPVVAVYSYDDFEEALERANDVPFAFQSAIYSKDPRRVERAIERLFATTVLVNEHTAFRVDWMPFGGLRRSGEGLGGIGDTMRAMTFEKLVITR